MQIKPLKKSDHQKCIQFAKKGMHFDKYTKNPIGLELYSRYFWYNELISATKIYAAYQGEQLAGVLLLNEFGKRKPYATFSKRLFVKIMEKLVRNFDRSNPYDDVNQMMLADYRKHYTPVAEINYLALTPIIRPKGSGLSCWSKSHEIMRGEKFICLLTLIVVTSFMIIVDLKDIMKLLLDIVMENNLCR